ncbi:glycerate kinase family protein [Streptococcus zalophi]|uniref:glycerate kinase family protein n=1 Tax=Streptococcus zalophi TaxID=640031 RepID=UPI00215C848D|nr:glycerate kinase [Streptococcus zalophi]MCR8967723.1 glycerate kinase [Streptococcus zalophi]
MKIVVAIDSFKGSASSRELNEEVKKAIVSILPDAEVTTFEIADGGEGTISAIKAGLGGVFVPVSTVDLMGNPITANYLITSNIAIIEVAEVVGIDKITPSKETFQQASTYGLASLFKDAMEKGVKEIILTLGGTGTSDGGIGLLEGLGGDIDHLPSLNKVKITALADVNNVYAGPEGYARVFGKQKGGTPDLINKIDEQAQDIVEKVRSKYDIDLQKIPGTGASGGLGGAVVLLGGTIESGFYKIAHLLNIESQIKTCDLIITGEGRMDHQTSNGKVPFGMAMMAKKHKIPIIAFCGAIGDDLGIIEELLLASYSIQKETLPLNEAMKKEKTLSNINRLTKNVIRTRFLS